MTIETINVGTSPNDGTGDSLRTSFIICNNNFSYLNTISGNASGNLNANIVSNGTSTFNIVSIANASITGTLTGNVTGAVTGNVTGNVSGNLVGSTVNATSIIGTISTNAQPNITSLGTLNGITLAANTDITSTATNIATVRFITRVVSNRFGTNLAATANIILSDGTNRHAAFTSDNVNVNVAFTYFGTITAGFQRHSTYKNVSGAAVYLILPNSNNNKGTNLIAVANDSVTSMTYTAFDSTAANVVAQIVNT